MPKTLEFDADLFAATLLQTPVSVCDPYLSFWKKVVYYHPTP